MHLRCAPWFRFQTILTTTLDRFTSHLEYSLGLGLGRSLLIFVYEGQLGLHQVRTYAYLSKYVGILYDPSLGIVLRCEAPSAGPSSIELVDGAFDLTLPYSKVDILE